MKDNSKTKTLKIKPSPADTRSQKLYRHSAMRKFFFTIILISTMTHLFGQVEKANYKVVATVGRGDIEFIT